jgi:RNA polymerase sigma factor (sigma-70 family)
MTARERRAVIMTFKDLCRFLNKRQEKRQVTKKRLLEMGSPVLLKHGAMPDGKVTVFMNGFVLYEEGERNTVFHLDEVRGKGIEYETVAPEFGMKVDRQVEEEVMMNLDWYIPLMMEGNDRLTKNQNAKESYHSEFSYSDIAEDISQLGFFVDFLRSEIGAIEMEKTKEIFTVLQEAMKPKQWKVYVLIEGEGMKQREVADLLSVTQQYVSREYKKACEKVVELRGLMKKIYACD